MTWLKKKASPSIHNITTKEEAERVLSAEPKVVLGFLNSLVVCILLIKGALCFPSWIYSAFLVSQSYKTYAQLNWLPWGFST